MTTPVPPSEVAASDADLLRRIAGGDDGALATLYDRYGRPAFGLARRITGEPGLAQDVVQEVFLAVWREPARYDPGGGEVRSRLLATTHRLAVCAVRKTSGHQPDTAARPPVGPDPGDHWAVHALDGLPPKQRQALVLAYYSGYTQRQIAEQTGTPLGTVRSEMVAGMRQLRTLLPGVSDAEGTRP